MKYSARQLVAMLRTPLGRRQIAEGLDYRAYPLYEAAARVHRARLPATTRFVAVVGTFGKTTTSRAIRAALGQDPEGHWSLNCWTNLARRVLAARASDRHVVIEAGIAAPGEMARYARLIRPDVTVVTSVGSEHNRTLRTLETTRDEKAHMVRALAASRGLAVLNGDDPNVAWMRGETRARVVTYGLGASNDVRGTDLRLDWPHGLELTVHAGGASARVRAPLLGEKMAYPLLAAAAVALDAGRSLDDVARALANVVTASARLEPVALPGDVWLLRDEHKSALETVHAALDVLAEIPARRRIVVLGDVAEPVGPQGPLYRDIGARLASIATRVVVVGGMFKPVSVGARRAGMPADALIDAGRTVQRAAAVLRDLLEPGDVVLLKGRDTQRLERIHLLLTGHEVGCAITYCDAKVRCNVCPMRVRGWGTREPA